MTYKSNWKIEKDHISKSFNLCLPLIEHPYYLSRKTALFTYVSTSRNEITNRGQAEKRLY